MDALEIAVPWHARLREARGSHERGALAVVVDVSRCAGDLSRPVRVGQRPSRADWPSEVDMPIPASSRSNGAPGT